MTDFSGFGPTDANLTDANKYRAALDVANRHGFETLADVLQANQQASLLIEQLPETHEGRNTWLKRYGET